MAALPAERSTSLLTLQGVACRRGERTLFTGLDFRLEPGAIVWMRGANGRGKTTLLRTIAGLSPPDAGKLLWREPQPAGRVLYLAHANALKEDLSAAESLRFLCALDGGTADTADVDAALVRVGMGGRRAAPVRTLSQGQRRRVALARLALPGAALVWLLDEPFDALDAAGVEMLNALLAEHAGRGGAIVLTSHLPLTITTPLPATISLDTTGAA